MGKFIRITLLILLFTSFWGPRITASEPVFIAQNSSKTFVVIADMCGATFTKEANKRFTKYAASNNTRAIDGMLANGELVVLRRGEKVTMIEHGYLISKIKRSNGQVVYTDTENLAKR